MAMTRPETSTTENAGVRRGEGDIKRKLALRMGVAAAMIVALLGGLALFDYMATQNAAPEPAVPHFTEPVPVGRKSSPTSAVPPRFRARTARPALRPTSRSPHWKRRRGLKWRPSRPCRRRPRHRPPRRQVGAPRAHRHLPRSLPRGRSSPRPRRVLQSRAG